MRQEDLRGLVFLANPLAESTTTGAYLKAIDFSVNPTVYYNKAL